MFDLGWDEMALIAVVALVVIGPKDLPVVLRQAGRWARKGQMMVGELRRGMDDMVRQAELADLKREVEKAADPGSLKKRIEDAIDPGGDIAKAFEPPPHPGQAGAALSGFEVAGEAEFLPADPTPPPPVSPPKP